MNKKIFAVIKSFKSWLNDNCVDDLMNEFIINLILLFFIFIFFGLAVIYFAYFGITDLVSFFASIF
jgi:hypothetical protein